MSQRDWAEYVDPKLGREFGSGSDCPRADPRHVEAIFNEFAWKALLIALHP